MNFLFLLLVFGSMTFCTKEYIEPDPENAVLGPEGEGAAANGDYFVSTKGSDANPGTYEKPFATWQRAFDVARPGDIIYIRGGVYKPEKPAHGNNVTMIYPSVGVGRDGEENNPICYFNFPGEVPILDCSQISTSGNFNTGLELVGVDFVQFKGLVIRNVRQRKNFVECFGVAAGGCSNLRFENMIIHDVGGCGFRYAGNFGSNSRISYDSTFFINCDAYNCCDSLPREPGAIIGNAADGFSTWNKSGAFFLFEGCRAWNCSDDGFDVGRDAVSIINNCWAFKNGALDGDGTGFKTGVIEEDNGSIITRIATNNISAENEHSGFFLVEYDNNYRVNARIYNNLFYKNGGSPFFSQNSLYPVTLSVWKNNISYAHSRPFSNTYQEYTESHNNWDYVPGYPGWVYTDTVTVSDEDFLSLDVDELDDPRNPDGSLPLIDFGRLVDGSDLIRAGTYVGMSDNPDMGVDWDFLDSKR